MEEHNTCSKKSAFILKNECHSTALGYLSTFKALFQVTIFWRISKFLCYQNVVRIETFLERFLLDNYNEKNAAKTENIAIFWIDKKKFTFVSHSCLARTYFKQLGIVTKSILLINLTIRKTQCDLNILIDKREMVDWQM